MLLLLILVGQGTILSTTPGAVFADLSIGSLHLYCCYHYIQSYNQHSHAYCCRNEKIIGSVIFFKCLVPSLSIAFSLLPKLRADTDWSNNNPVTRPDQAKHNYKLNVVVVVVDLVTCWHWHYLLTTEQWSGGGQAPAPHSTVRKVATAQSCGGHCCSRLLLSVIHLHQSRVLGISDINEDTDYTWLSTSTIQWDTWDGDQSVTLNHEYPHECAALAEMVWCLVSDITESAAHEPSPAWHWADTRMWIIITAHTVHSTRVVNTKKN